MPEYVINDDWVLKRVTKDSTSFSEWIKGITATVKEALKEKDELLTQRFEEGKQDLPDMVKVEEAVTKAEERMKKAQEKMARASSIGKYVSELTAKIGDNISSRIHQQLTDHESLNIDIDFIKGKRKSLSSALYDVAKERGIESEGILYLIQSLPDLESFLYSTSAGKYYRDHTEHQLRVAVLGDFLLEQDLGKGNLLNHIADLTELDKNLIKEKVWWVMGLIHDIGYPLQKMTTSINYSLLNQILKCYPMLDLDVVPFEINISNKKIKPYLKLITQGLSKEAKKLILNGAQVSHEEIPIPAVQHFKSTENGHPEFKFESSVNLDHGVVGAISLLKSLGTPEEIKENKDELEGYLKAAQAIALHNFKDELPDYIFDNNPLAFLLVLADEMQEWGRPIPLQIRDSYFTAEMNKITLLDEVILTIDEVQWLMEYKKMRAKELTNFQFHYFCDSKNKAFGRLRRGKEFPKTRIVLQDYQKMTSQNDLKELEKELSSAALKQLQEIGDIEDPRLQKIAKEKLLEMQKEDLVVDAKKLEAVTKSKEKLISEFYIVI
jgi:hypothetical protein